ncbi:hypothetical protein F511_26355 [Dorcoceras hygrometricum]|uniref:Uncharacterized protein n=1 Tax=Dorcoceras hygrometricum TaxID=472368 RepID=A0A2Z7D003_9LAMI|nr:hypothetical protein F511_26355 [Dorcoceras hygrometricum]
MQSGDFNQCEGYSNPFLGSASSSSPLMVDSNVVPIVFAPSASNDASERFENICIGIYGHFVTQPAVFLQLY